MRTHVPGLLFLMICVACGGGEKPPVVDPPTTGRLQGVAVLSGADNSEGVEVHIVGTALRTLTGPTGAYSLADVPAGTHQVVARASEHGEAEVSVTVTAGQLAVVPRLTLYSTRPELRSSVPRFPVRGMLLTLRGRGFGPTQGSSLVRMGGEAVTEYTRWTDTEVQLRIPRTLVPGTVQAVVTVGARETALPVRIGKARPLAAGDLTSLALKADGTVVAWGSRQAGQGVVPPGAANVIAVAAGGAHNLVLHADGTLRGWGMDNHGQATVAPGLTAFMP